MINPEADMDDYFLVVCDFIIRVRPISMRIPKIVLIFINLAMDYEILSGLHTKVSCHTGDLYSGTSTPSGGIFYDGFLRASCQFLMYNVGITKR